MCIVGASFHAAQEIVEEIMLKNVETQDVLHLTGWEGIWGMIMTAISLLIFVEFECPFDQKNCVNGHIDDYRLVINELSQSPTHFWLTIGFILSSAVYNGFATALN